MRRAYSLAMAFGLLLMPVGLRTVTAQHHHHYRHHHHQTYDPVLADVQSALSRLGFYHTHVDGVYGSESAHAIRTFQHSRGLPESGVIDGYLLAALGLSVPPPPQGAPPPPQGVPPQPGAAIPQGVPPYQPSTTLQQPVVAPQTSKPAVTSQTPTVPPGFQSVPIGPPPGAAAATQVSPTPTPTPTASSTGTPQPTPIPNK